MNEFQFKVASRSFINKHIICLPLTLSAHGLFNCFPAISAILGTFYCVHHFLQEQWTVNWEWTEKRKHSDSTVNMQQIRAVQKHGWILELSFYIFIYFSVQIVCIHCLLLQHLFAPLWMSVSSGRMDVSSKKTAHQYEWALARELDQLRWIKVRLTINLTESNSVAQCGYKMYYFHSWKTALLWCCFQQLVLDFVTIQVNLNSDGAYLLVILDRT